MFTKKFWKATAERAVKTLAQSAIATATAAGTGLVDTDWVGIASTAGMATVLSVLSSVASSGTNGDGPSLGAAQLHAEHFGGIEVRELEDPYEGRFSGGSTAGAVQVAVSLMLALPMLLWLLVRTTPWLKTNAGNDFQAKQMGGSASATAVAKWV